MKILVVTSKLPYPPTGADEQDRYHGVRILQGLGHSVTILAKRAAYQSDADILAMSSTLHAPVRVSPYSSNTWTLHRLADLRWLDGASFEYGRLGTVSDFRAAITEVKPEIIWADGSYAWPLIQVAHAYQIPIIVRSLQIESAHLFVDHGVTFGTLARAVGKHLGEYTLARNADCVVALNHEEEQLYRTMGADTTITIPLRNLPAVVEEAPVSYGVTDRIRVLFGGSTFTVQHNLEGALRILMRVAPEIECQAPGTFTFHITGAKFPDEVRARLPANVIYEGYRNDYSEFVRSMDIALATSLGSVGMHGKLFEPLARGIPTIGESKALGGYPFVDGETIILAETPDQIIDALLRFRDVRVRARIGSAARALSEKLFSRATVSGLVAHAINLTVGS
ncbi:glycosyltransferase [Patescibacteria group bacterium]|nr:glycosyltransferase [Patescibacteria group bacterium]